MLACRRELVAYDRNQRGQGTFQFQRTTIATENMERDSNTVVPVVGRCYGCASAATEHCLTLLRALATRSAAREALCEQGLIQELVEHNLRKGTIQVRLYSYVIDF